MPLYKQDSNDTSKQTPDITPGGTSRFSFAECPTNEILTKRPSHVNVNSVGTYAFLYESTSSFGVNVSGQIGNFITGSKVNHANAGGIKLEVSPIAWRRTDAADAVGDITFVYVRVR